MSTRLRSLFSFPNPVNEVAARTVAAGVLLMAVSALAFDQRWLLVPLTYGFFARVLTGPTLSPLGQLATRVVAPSLPVAPRPTPGPPKRFAQGVGATVCTASVIVWTTAGFGVARWLLGLLATAAFCEAALGLCLGCTIFSGLMRARLIPQSVCEDCADVSRRHPVLARSDPA
jgi:hypothetical protein